MLTKGGRSKTRHDDVQVTPDSTTEPANNHDFQEGDYVFFHTEEGQHIFGTVGQITNAHCQILFDDGTEQWARFSRLKKLSCSFEEEGPSPTPSDNNSSSSCSSNNVRISFPSREQQQKTDVVCVECNHVKKVSSRKARLFTASSPYKCSRCSNNQPNHHKTNIGGSSNSNLNNNSHQTPTFQKKPSIPRQLLKHLSTSESSTHHQQQQQQQISHTNLNCIGDIPNRQLHSLVHSNNSLTSPSSSSSASQYLPTSSSLSSSSLQSPTRPMMNYRGSPTHSQHHQLQYQQHNSIGSTSTNNNSSSSSSTNNILNQQSGSMTIKPIRAVHLSNSIKTGTNSTTTTTTTPVPRTNLCFHCGNRTFVYDRVHCNMCERYCHISCLPSVTPAALEGDKFWDVMCSKCGTQSDSEKGGSKVFSCRRNIQNWTDVVNLIINCLKVKSLGQQHFDFDVEIMPFFDNNIDRLHLPRQYKSASREDRKVNLLAALKNSRFREVHAKHAGSLWALKSDVSSQSSAIAPLPSSSSSSTVPMNMNTKIQKSKINNMTTAVAASTTTSSTNKNIISNSNDKRDLYPNHQLRSPTTTTATIIPNHANTNNNSSSNGSSSSSSNTVKKSTISYVHNTNSSSSPSSPLFKSTTNLTIPNRPNNLTLIPHNNNNNHVVNSSVSPPVLNLSVNKFKNNTTITTTTVHSPPYNASKSSDMSLQNSNNNTNNNFSNTNTGNNSVTVTSFPRVVSKETLLRNPPLMTTNIILSPTKTSLSNNSSGGGFQNKSMGYSSSHASSSDCDKSKKLIQGQNSSIGVDSRNSPRKSIKLNQSQKDTSSDKSKPKSSSLVHTISTHQSASDVNALQRLRIRTPTKQDSSSATTTTTTIATNSPKSNIETVSKDSQMKKKDTMSSFPSSSSKTSIITRPQSCIPILSPKSDERKRPHQIESNDVHELKMTNDSTVISFVKNNNTTSMQTSNTIVVRATKIARMDDTSPPHPPAPATNINKTRSKEIRPIRSKLTRSSSLNIKNGKITNNNKNNNHYKNDGKQISTIGRLMRNRGKSGKGQITNSERKDDNNDNNLVVKVFNPPNGLTDSSPLNINGYNSKLSSGNKKKALLNPVNQNDTLGDGENNQEDEENTTLNSFSSNLLNAAMFAGIRIQSLPRCPETKMEIVEEARKVGEYLLAEEFTTKPEVNDNETSNVNDNNNPNSNNNSDNNNVKRLFSNGWPSLNNYPNTTVANNCNNNNDREDISRNNENQLVQNNNFTTMKTKSQKTSKRNLDDVDSYDILSVKVGEDGIIRYEVIWYEENSSDDEAENIQNIFPEYEDMEIVEDQQQSEKQEKNMEGNGVKEVVIQGTTTTSAGSSLKNGENSIKKIDIGKEKTENNKYRNIKTIQIISPTKPKASSSEKINIKSEEEMEARKSSLGASKTSSSRSSSDNIRPSLKSPTGISTCEFPNNNININYNRKQFPALNTVSIDDPDEDDQIQILSTPSKKSKSSSSSASILPMSTNPIPYVIDLTEDSP